MLSIWQTLARQCLSGHPPCLVSLSLLLTSLASSILPEALGPKFSSGEIKDIKARQILGQLPFSWFLSLIYVYLKLSHSVSLFSGKEDSVSNTFLALESLPFILCLIRQYFRHWVPSSLRRLQISVLQTVDKHLRGFWCARCWSHNNLQHRIAAHMELLI